MKSEKIENIAPARPRECAFFGALLLAFSLALLVPGDRGVAKLFFGVASMLTALLMFACAIYSDKWTYGFEVVDGGFHFKAPMRKERFISFAAITSVTAAAVQNEFGESSITLNINSVDGRAWISERNHDFYPFVGRIKLLPGFDLQAWQSSEVPDYEAVVVGGLIPKRTTIFVRRSSA